MKSYFPSAIFTLAFCFVLIAVRGQDTSKYEYALLYHYWYSGNKWIVKYDNNDDELITDKEVRIDEDQDVTMLRMLEYMEKLNYVLVATTSSNGTTRAYLKKKIN